MLVSGEAFPITCWAFHLEGSMVCIGCKRIWREDVDSTRSLLLWPQVWSFWEMTQRDDRSLVCDRENYLPWSK